MVAQNKRIIWMVIGIAALLSIPFIAMQFTDEVNWKLSDFGIMGTALLAIGLSYEFIARKSLKITYRAAFAIGLLGAFLLFWVNAAVGIIGNEGQAANLLYASVFLVGAIGSIISRFKAYGMAVTLLIAAIVTILVPVVALMIWPAPETSWSPGIVQVFMMSGFFSLLFLVSASLFYQSRT